MSAVTELSKVSAFIEQKYNKHFSNTDEFRIASSIPRLNRVVLLHLLSSPLMICLITIRNKINASIEDRGPRQNTDREIKILRINNNAVADFTRNKCPCIC